MVSDIRAARCSTPSMPAVAAISCGRRITSPITVLRRGLPVRCLMASVEPWKKLSRMVTSAAPSASNSSAVAEPTRLAPPTIRKRASRTGSARDLGGCAVLCSWRELQVISLFAVKQMPLHVGFEGGHRLGSRLRIGAAADAERAAGSEGLLVSLLEALALGIHGGDAAGAFLPAAIGLLVEDAAAVILAVRHVIGRSLSKPCLAPGYVVTSTRAPSAFSAAAYSWHCLKPAYVSAPPSSM